MTLTHNFKEVIEEEYQGKEVRLLAFPCQAKLVENSAIVTQKMNPESLQYVELSDPPTADQLAELYDGCESENYRVVFSNDGSPVSGATCKAGYLPHDLDDVQSMIEAAYLAMTDQFETATIDLVWENGHVVQIKFAEEIEISPNDQVQITLTFNARYDGQAFTAIFGLFRLICTNGMVVPVEDTKYAQFKRRHTKNMREDIEQMTLQFTEVAKSIEQIIDNCRRMAEIQVDFDEIYTKVFGERPENKYKDGKLVANNKQTRYDSTKEGIENVLYKEQAILGLEKSKKTTGWLALNSVHTYMQTEKTGKGWDHIRSSNWANARPEVKKIIEILS